MKKLLALILVLAMIFAFVSCTLFGDDGNGDNTGDGGNTDGGNEGNGDDSGINGQLPGNGIDLPLVDIEPDGIE